MNLLGWFWRKKSQQAKRFMYQQGRGFAPPAKSLQLDEMDMELRSALWNCLDLFVWSNWKRPTYTGEPTPANEVVDAVLDHVWIHALCLPVDNRSRDVPHDISAFRRVFFGGEWEEAYYYIQFICRAIPPQWRADLKRSVNSACERHNSGYRLCGSVFAAITDSRELEAVDLAMSDSPDEVNTHLEAATRLLFNRGNVDTRNSIKESISAVESLCKRVTENRRATLGDALMPLKERGVIHPSLFEGMKKFYGYTNDSGGIRHALLDGTRAPSFAEAKYMLVACSAFINYLVAELADRD